MTRNEKTDLINLYFKMCLTSKFVGDGTHLEICINDITIYPYKQEETQHWQIWYVIDNKEYEIITYEAQGSAFKIIREYIRTNADFIIFKKQMMRIL